MIKRAICIEDFILFERSFKKDIWYYYDISIHEETELEIFFVQHKDGTINDTLPIIGKKFHRHFDDIEQRREDKINLILNGSEV